MPSFAFKDLYHYWLVILITGVLIACLGMILTHTTLMIRTKITKLHLSPIRLHLASSVRIPSSVNNFREIHFLLQENLKISCMVVSKCMRCADLFVGQHFYSIWHQSV